MPAFLDEHCGVLRQIRQHPIDLANMLPHEPSGTHGIAPPDGIDDALMIRHHGARCARPIGQEADSIELSLGRMDNTPGEGLSGHDGDLSVEGLVEPHEAGKVVRVVAALAFQQGLQDIERPLVMIGGQGRNRVSLDGLADEASRKHGSRRDRLDEGPALGADADEAVLSQEDHGLPNRLAADPKRCGNIGFADLLAGQQPSEDDLVSQDRVYLGRDRCSRFDRDVTCVVQRHIEPSEDLSPSGGPKSRPLGARGSRRVPAMSRSHMRRTPFLQATARRRIAASANAERTR